MIHPVPLIYQAYTTSKGYSFPSTDFVKRATHIVVDPDSGNENLPLRSLPLPQLVVTIGWLWDRFLRRGGYEIERSEAEVEARGAEEELDELEEEEPVEEPEVASM